MKKLLLLLVLLSLPVAASAQPLQQLSRGKVTAGNFSTTDGGLVVRAKRGTITFETITATTLFSLPAGAIILDISVDVTTAFNDSGTDTLDVGITGTADKYIDGLDIAATGRKVATLASLGVSVGSAAVNVVATYIEQNSNASTGAAVITVLYIVL